MYLGSDFQLTEHKHKTTPIFISWTPPPRPYLKLNTDDSTLPNLGSGGIGEIFCDENGRWILGYMRYFPRITNLQAELLAVRERLEMAVKKHFDHLIIESDSLVALNLLTHNTNTKLKFLIYECRSMIQKMTFVRWQLIFREGNRIAKNLASMGRILKNSQISILEAPPPTLIHMLKTDQGPGTETRFVQTRMD